MNKQSTWLREDAEAAQLEGWNVFDVNGQSEIQRDDEMGVFENDALAVFHCYNMALTGSQLHRKALRLVLATQNIRPSTKSAP